MGVAIDGRRHVHLAWLAVAVIALGIGLVAQEQSAIYLLVIDQKGTPVLDLKPSDVEIREDVGPSAIVSLRRFGWPLKLTVLVDNGPRTAEALVHYRTGLKKFFAGLPSDIPVSLIETAPAPRWLVRDTKDRVQIEKGVNLIAPDGALGRFSDALIEYAERLDEEFRNVSAEQLQPYLPVLVFIATTDQDGSERRREPTLRMIASLRKRRVWTTLIMMSPSKAGRVPAVDYDDGQNAELAKAVQEATAGRYVPITGSGSSALSSTILPEVARAIAARYIRQMTQHRIVMERPAGASGPMKDFALTLRNYPGAKIVLSPDGSFP